MRRIIGAALVVFGLGPTRLLGAEIVSGPLQISEPGQLFVDAKPVVLAGINVPPAAAMCRAGNSQWPCGKVALAAFKSLVGNKDVVCAGLGSSTEATCFLEGKDLSLWMLAEGWAMNTNGDNRPYSAAGTEAANMRKGVWRAGGKPPKEPWRE